MRAPSFEARALAAHIIGRVRPEQFDLALAAAAVEHGVGPLLYRALVDRGEFRQVQPPAAEVLVGVAREALLVDAVRHAHLEQTIEALDGLGVAPLLFKGAAVSHSHYQEPWLRVRGDTDLLVRKDEVPAADATLSRMGLARLPRPTGSRVTQQARYTMRWRSVDLAYDLHWRIADPHVFADALPYDVLASAAVDGPVAGSRRLCNVHALLTACVHRVAHHFDTDHLLLLHDIFLLAGALTHAEWERCCTEARTTGLRTVCKRGLALAAELFDLQIPESAGAAFESCGEEPSALFVTAPLTRLTLLRSDLRSLPRWRDRLALLYEHAFPSADYMQRSAGDYSASLAPLMYVERLVRGLNAWRHPL